MWLERRRCYMMTRQEKNKLRLEKRVSNRRKAKKWVIFCFQGLEEILKLVDLAHKVNWF